MITTNGTGTLILLIIFIMIPFFLLLVFIVPIISESIDNMKFHRTLRKAKCKELNNLTGVQNNEKN